MASRRLLLELKSVAKSFGETRVLDNVDLAVEDGEFITILGPSGSGKTTILRMIGGFTTPTAGEILLDGKDISGLPINRRPFNTVFQDYALFPHMTVAGNVGYGLQIRGVAKAEIKRRVADALGLVHLAQLAERYPAQLSGGQKQRVALARAIICQPRLILLDEPLAALDVELRKQMQLFLKNIQREIKTTFLFVTHDQEEAISMADRICVMNDGRIQQIGSPLDVYYRPHTEFVARFFGDNNLISGRLGATAGDMRSIDTSFGSLACAVDDQPEVVAAALGGSAYAVVRPESIQLAASGGQLDGCDNKIGATITAVEFSGATTLVRTKPQGSDIEMRVKLPSRADGTALQVGAQVALGWRRVDSRLVPV
ncbi:MAG TPA: ABC transporter ATP-binding protein [Dongiaceae bacterium]|nr:ABC transporter ATP-binding protein [Dongiaceae bacterium]